MRPRVLAVAVAVLLAWLVVLALLPAVLGLRAVVVTGDADGFDEGTVVLTRDVPASDVRVGDRISLDSRIVDVVRASPGVLVTEGREGPADLRRWLTADSPSLPRVALSVPVMGLPFAGPSGLGLWLLLGLVATLALLAVRQRRPGGRGRYQAVVTTPRVPIG
ncbi:hypothetical protein BH11ACT8_BH11ACT8_01710 [soil metagenome]